MEKKFPVTPGDGQLRDPGSPAVAPPLENESAVGDAMRKIVEHSRRHLDGTSPQGPGQNSGAAK